MGVNNVSMQPLFELYSATPNPTHAQYMAIYKEYRIRAVRVKYTLGGIGLNEMENFSDSYPLLFGYAWSRTCAYAVPSVETWANLSKEPDFRFKVMRPSNGQAENTIYASIRASTGEQDYIRSGFAPTDFNGVSYFSPEFRMCLALKEADAGKVTFWAEYEFDMEYRESKI